MSSECERISAFPKRTASEVERRVLELCDMEKQRIGQDLHDTIGQQLTGISLMCKALEHRLRQAQHPEADSLREMAEMVDQAIDQIREVVAGMAPSEIQSQDAATALEILCLRIERIHQIRATFTDELAEPLTDPDIVKNLYFVAAESINNAIRHGEADQIDVRLRPGTATHLGELLIRNNGSCNMEKFSEQTGIGLSSMRFRAEALNGDLDIVCYPDNFVAIVCSFRLPPSPKEKAKVHDGQE